MRKNVQHMTNTSLLFLMYKQTIEKLARVVTDI